MKSLASLSKHPHPAFRWWAALVTAIVLLLASLAAGAVRHYVLNWF
jgi:predicted benzoate:H+ symporter BenE